ncbi:hypothetical protein H9Q72_007222 [Fusarium xylarioides]|uniref:Ankyrin n=1 Tax=Fusarium xylarioides TaxID=221167 RepID=A0A9P7HQN4_9HYPO|nr:hypothetical protein H9Q72_007222 [Fusarium xylarioides]
MITAVPGCVFVADGLDECSQLSNGDASVARFLRDIMGARASTDARVLLVSRDEPEIREALREHKETLLEYRIGTNDVQADTEAFSQSVVNGKLSGKSEDLRLAISKSMTDKCQGQFLWIKMQEPSLRNTMSKKRLHEVMENTPSGLDRLYDQNWSRIMNMSHQDRDRTFALLRWTAFTFTPIAVYAVIEAVLIDQFGELDPDDYPESVDDEFITGEILGLCGPLVEVHYDKEDSIPGFGTLHIPHFSVRQYLMKHLPAPLWMQPRDIINMQGEMIHHTAIARACVQYLSLPQVWEEEDGSEPCLKAFLIYATLFWVRHAKSSFMDPSLRDLSKAFLKSDNFCFKSFANYRAGDLDPDSGPKSIFQPQLRPFELVFYFKWIDMAYYLMDDADVNEIGSFGRLPIFSACRSGSAESVKMLIRHGADLSITDDFGYTCLYEAVYYGFEDIVRILVESNVDLSLQNRFGYTPLHLAGYKGNVKCYQYLLEQGADPTIRDTNGRNVIHLACFHAGHAELLRLILQNGPSSLATDQAYDVGSPLMLVAINGDFDMAKILFEFGAAPSLFITDILGYLPLQYAASFGHTKLVELITATNLDGETPLHAAAIGDNVEVLKLLMEVPGASVNQKTTFGFSPLFIASRNGYQNIVELLLSLDSVDKDSRNWLGLGPLFAAVANGHLEVTKLLLSKGSHVHHQVSIGGDLLWWAQRSSKPELIQLLKTQQALGGTPSGSCGPLPSPYIDLEPLLRDAETVYCIPGAFWCYVCTLSVRDDREFHCVDYVRDLML